MLSNALLDRIRQMLAEGTLSQRKIARLTGVSRGTIGALAHGKIARRAPQPRGCDEPFDAAGLPVRCAGCGGMVLMPCLHCRIQNIREREALLLRRRAMQSQSRGIRPSRFSESKRAV